MSIFILLIILLILFLVVNFLYKRTNAYNNQFVDVRKFLLVGNEDDNSIDVVNLGSNGPKFAFDYKNVKGLHCENWAVGPQSFEYDYVILKKYISKIKPGGTVILPICPGKFFLDKYSKQKKMDIKYYLILRKNEMEAYSFKEYFMDFKFPILRYKRLKRLIKDYPKDNRLSITSNSMIDKNVEEDAKWWVRKCWNPEFGIDIENMKELPEKVKLAVEYNINMLSNIANLCFDNNIKLVFAILPVTKALGAFFSDSYVDKYMKQYVGDANIRGDYKLVDYFRDYRFQSKDYYINSFFMNRTGARIFTEAFVTENM